MDNSITAKTKALVAAVAATETGDIETGRFSIQRVSAITGVPAKTISYLKSSGQLDKYFEDIKPELMLQFNTVANLVLEEQVTRLSDAERRKRIPDNVLSLWGGIATDKMIGLMNNGNQVQINTNIVISPDDILKKYRKVNVRNDSDQESGGSEDDPQEAS